MLTCRALAVRTGVISISLRPSLFPAFLVWFLQLCVLLGAKPSRTSANELLKSPDLLAKLSATVPAAFPVSKLGFPQSICSPPMSAASRCG